MEQALKVAIVPLVKGVMSKWANKIQNFLNLQGRHLQLGTCHSALKVLTLQENVDKIWDYFVKISLAN